MGSTVMGTLLGYIDPGAGFTIYNAGSLIILSLLTFFGLVSLFFKKIWKSFKKYKKWLILILLIIGLATIGVMMNKKAATLDKRIIILGFDGLSPEIVEPMMREGELPYFSQLKEKGSYKRLSTTNPAQSPVAWAAFSTGKNPGKNGIFDFIVRDPKTYYLNLSLSNFSNGRPKKVVKSKSFWQYAAAKKVPTTIINCPVTFPPDKVCGSMLSGMGVPDILGTEGTFTFYTSEPLKSDKDIGGNVFHVEKSPIMVMNLIGPKTATLLGKESNLTIPFKATLLNDAVKIEYRQQVLELKAGQWSGWQEASFDAGWGRKIKGIFKFYLVEIQPEFKLYISPINLDPRDPFFQISYPKRYARELTKSIGLYHTQGMPMDTWAVNEKRMNEGPFLEEADKIFVEKKAILDLELGRFKKGVLFAYFESPDIIQHMFWRYIDPEHPLYEKDAPREYKEMIRTWYKKMDEVLGDVMKKMNDDDVLIVLSDHGFNAFRRTVHLNSWLRSNGYLQLYNAEAESGAELLQDVDWANTKAYAIGFGSIYINQAGREGKGIVNPGKESELLKEEISRKLKQWIDEKYHQPVVKDIYTREEIFWGDHSQETPDLYVGFNIGYRASWQTALGAVPSELIEDNLKKWSGDHLFDPKLIPGIIFSNKIISAEFPSIYDIAPSILKLIGYTDEEIKIAAMDGKLLFE